MDSEQETLYFFYDYDSGYATDSIIYPGKPFKYLYLRWDKEGHAHLNDEGQARFVQLGPDFERWRSLRSAGFQKAPIRFVAWWAGRTSMGNDYEKGLSTVQSGLLKRPDSPVQQVGDSFYLSPELASNEEIREGWRNFLEDTFVRKDAMPASELKSMTEAQIRSIAEWVRDDVYYMGTTARTARFFSGEMTGENYYYYVTETGKVIKVPGNAHTDSLHFTQPGSSVINAHEHGLQPGSFIDPKIACPIFQSDLDSNHLDCRSLFERILNINPS